MTGCDYCFALLMTPRHLEEVLLHWKRKQRSLFLSFFFNDKIQKWFMSSKEPTVVLPNTWTEFPFLLRWAEFSRTRRPRVVYRREEWKGKRERGEEEREENAFNVLHALLPVVCVCVHRELLWTEPVPAQSTRPARRDQSVAFSCPRRVLISLPRPASLF